MTTVEALKKLAAKLLDETVDNIPGETIPDVISYIAENYEPAVNKEP